MGSKATTYVWAKSEQSGSTLVALLALADWSDDNGKSYHSINKIAQKCRCSPRYAQKLIRKLQDDNELEVDEGKGINTDTGATNLYRIIGVAGSCIHSPEESQDQGVNNRTPLGVNNRTPLGVNNRTPLDTGVEDAENGQGVNYRTPNWLVGWLDLYITNDLDPSNQPVTDTNEPEETAMHLRDLLIDLGLDLRKVQTPEGLTLDLLERITFGYLRDREGGKVESIGALAYRIRNLSNAEPLSWDDKETEEYKILHPNYDARAERRRAEWGDYADVILT